MVDLKRCDRCGHEGALDEFECVCIDADNQKGDGIGNATFGIRYSPDKPITDAVREKHQILPGFTADLCLDCRRDLHHFFTNVGVEPRHG